MGRPALHTLSLVLFTGILFPSPCQSEASNGDAPHVGDGDIIVDDGGGCTIYLAPSAIPNAGLGTFTAVEIDCRGTANWFA